MCCHCANHPNGDNVVDDVIFCQFEPDHVVQVYRHHYALSKAFTRTKGFERTREKKKRVLKRQGHYDGVCQRVQCEID